MLSLQDIVVQYLVMNAEVRGIEGLPVDIREHIEKRRKDGFYLIRNDRPAWLPSYVYWDQKLWTQVEAWSKEDITKNLDYLLNLMPKAYFAERRMTIIIIIFTLIINNQWLIIQHPKFRQAVLAKLEEFIHFDYASLETLSPLDDERRVIITSDFLKALHHIKAELSSFSF